MNHFHGRERSVSHLLEPWLWPLLFTLVTHSTVRLRFIFTPERLRWPLLDNILLHVCAPPNHHRSELPLIVRASLHPPSVHYILSAQTETPLTPVIHIQYRYMQYLVRFKTSRRSPAISRIYRWSKGKPVEPHTRITLADWWGTLKSVSSPCLISILRSSVTRA